MANQQETWETVVRTRESDRVSVQYQQKHANIKFAYSNACGTLRELLSSLFPEEELKAKADREERPAEVQRVEMMLHVTVQTSGDGKRLRLVVGKVAADQSEEETVWYDREKGAEWSTARARVDYYFSWRIPTAEIAKKLGCERVMFVDGEEKATKRPHFTVAKEGEKITITAPINKFTEAAFKEAFPKKPKKVAT